MRTIIFIFLLAIVVSCKTNNPNDSKNSNYEVVFDYIKNIEPYKDDGIYVVDTLFYIPRLTIYGSLIKGNDSNRGLQIIDSLDNEDQKFYFNNEKMESLGKLKSKSKYNLYFSKPRGNTIDFEILDNGGNIQNNYDYLTTFGVGYIYSVTIDKGIIKDVKKVEMIYN